LSAYLVDRIRAAPNIEVVPRTEVTAGGAPHTDRAAKLGIARDEGGHLVTGHGSVKRCASAVGEGSMAVALVHSYLATG
jgi:thioredoxin reductase (NADPH)